jgi:nicotinamidase-related amidase
MIVRMSMSDSHLTRDRPIRRGSCALLIIDVQNATCDPAGPSAFRAAGVGGVIGNIRQILDAFRQARLEVAFTVMENLTADGRDRSLDYKLSGIFIARGSRDAKVVTELEPATDELVLPKTSSSVFNSTMLDYLLRNIGITDVFVAGLLTDQCIDHAVKDGADRGYYMTCIHDACAAETEERHRAALDCFKGYCRLLATADVLRLVAAAQ